MTAFRNSGQKLTLEQHEFELHWFTYMRMFFSSKYYSKYTMCSWLCLWIQNGGHREMADMAEKWADYKLYVNFE